MGAKATSPRQVLRFTSDLIGYKHSASLRLKKCGSLELSGIEWLVEAFGCSEATLQDQNILATLFHAIVSEMQLQPVRDPVWHQFPRAGGITGIWLLQESHLAIHTFPEFRSACLNLFCCTQRPAPDWKARLVHSLGVSEVQIREFQRIYGPKRKT